MMKLIKNNQRIVLPFILADTHWFKLTVDDIVIQYLRDHNMLPAVASKSDLFELLKKTNFNNIKILTQIFSHLMISSTRRGFFALEVDYQDVKTMSSADLMNLLDNECDLWLQHIRNYFKNTDGSTMTLLEIVKASSKFTSDKNKEVKDTLFKNLKMFDMWGLLTFLHQESISSYIKDDFDMIINRMENTYNKVLDSKIIEAWKALDYSQNQEMKVAFKLLNEFRVVEHKLLAQVADNKAVRMLFENKILEKIGTEYYGGARLEDKVMVTMNKDCFNTQSQVVNVIGVSNFIDKKILTEVVGLPEINGDEFLNNLMIDLCSSLVEKPKRKVKGNLIQLNLEQYQEIAVNRVISWAKLLEIKELLFINTSAVDGKVKTLLDSIMQLYKETNAVQYNVVFAPIELQNNSSWEYILTKMGLCKSRTGSFSTLQKSIDKKLNKLK